MNRRILIGLAVLLTASAGFGADIFVAHGINGEDLGLPRSLPVDVVVAGGCALDDLMFEEIRGPVDLDPGSYALEIRVSDGVDGTCTGPLAVSGTADVALGENATLMAHLTEEGTPTITKFVNDLRAAGMRSRLVVRRAAGERLPQDVKSPPIQPWW